MLSADTISFGWRELGIKSFLRPIVIAAGALGGRLPAADLVLSQGATVELVGGDGQTTSETVQAIDLPDLGVAAKTSVSTAAYVRLTLAMPAEILAAGVCLRVIAALTDERRPNARFGGESMLVSD